MKVILRENIENLGKKGDIVDVAAGYGRNYLIPSRMALQVTPSNMKMIEMEQQALRRRYDQERVSHQTLIDRLNQTRLTFVRKAGKAAEKDVIFGSVSSADIKEALAEREMEVDKKKILLEEPIKRLGNYTVPIKVFHEEKAEVKIEVISEVAFPEEKEPSPGEEKQEEVAEKEAEEKDEKEKERPRVIEESKVEEKQKREEEEKEAEAEKVEGDEEEPR